MKQYSNRKYLILMLWALIFPTLAIQAQKTESMTLGNLSDGRCATALKEDATTSTAVRAEKASR